MMQINTIAANRDLIRILGGSPSGVREMRSGDLLVEVRNYEQSQKIVNIKELASTKVSVKSNDRMNQCQGTIYYRNAPGFTEEEIMAALNESGDIRVSNIYRMQKRADGALVPMPIYLLTFQSTELPSHVTVGWTRCSTRLYIPRPRRCFKCQEFGHGIKTCRSSVDICAQCANRDDSNNPTHPRPCTAPSLCSNCNGDHPSSSQDCPRYQTEVKILRIKTENRLTYSAAKRTVLGGPSSSVRVREQTSYSSIVKPISGETNIVIPLVKSADKNIPIVNTTATNETSDAASAGNSKASSSAIKTTKNNKSCFTNHTLGTLDHPNDNKNNHINKQSNSNSMKRSLSNISIADNSMPTCSPLQQPKPKNKKHHKEKSSSQKYT